MQQAVRIHGERGNSNIDDLRGCKVGFHHGHEVIQQFILLGYILGTKLSEYGGEHLELAVGAHKVAVQMPDARISQRLLPCKLHVAGLREDEPVPQISDVSLFVEPRDIVVGCGDFRSAHAHGNAAKLIHNVLKHREIHKDIVFDVHLQRGIDGIHQKRDSALGRSRIDAGGLVAFNGHVEIAQQRGQLKPAVAAVDRGDHNDVRVGVAARAAPIHPDQQYVRVLRFVLVLRPNCRLLRIRQKRLRVEIMERLRRGYRGGRRRRSRLRRHNGRGHRRWGESHRGRGGAIVLFRKYGIAWAGQAKKQRAAQYQHNDQSAANQQPYPQQHLEPYAALFLFLPRAGGSFFRARLFFCHLFVLPTGRASISMECAATDGAQIDGPPICTIHRV